MKIGEYVFDLKSGILSASDGRTIFLKRNAEKILIALATADGNVVSKDDLLGVVWPDVTVSEDSLYQAIAEARRALGPKGSEIIKTVPRQGYQLKSAPTNAPIISSSWRIIAALLVVLAVVITAYRAQNNSNLTDTRHPTIAVLPFEPITAGDNWKRRGHGLAMEVAVELARNDWLNVIAPEASESLSGSPFLQAAKELGARLLLGGTLAAENGTLRISARMIDATDGKLVWSDRWTSPEAGFLELETEILDRIAGPLSGALTGVIAREELKRAKDRSPRSLDAYDHFLLGLEAKHHWNREGFTRAVEHFQRAIKLDPDYAKAWSFLSLNLSFLALEAESHREREDLWRMAKDASERAYALDPDDPEVLWRLARERGASGDFGSAEKMLRRSVELASGNADVLMVAAWTSHYAGLRGAESLAWARRAHELTPIRPAKYTISLGIAAFTARNYELCVTTLRNAPPSPEVLAHLAAAEALLGNVTEAQGVAKQLREARPKFALDDLFGSVGLGGFENLDDLRRGATLAGVPISRTKGI